MVDGSGRYIVAGATDGVWVNNQGLGASDSFFYTINLSSGEKTKIVSGGPEHLRK
jgi:hypothetical protein